MMATMASQETSGALPPSKSDARALQTAILQLCNEHVSYNSRLQIVGVLCLSIDDQEDELVVKINNTLKRMNSANEGKSTTTVVNQYRSQQSTEPMKIASDKVPIPQEYSPPPRRQNGPIPQRANPPVPNMVPPPVTITKEAYTSAHTSLYSQSTLKTSPSPHKGRKRSNPVKVHHVIDEGEFMNRYGGVDH